MLIYQAKNLWVLLYVMLCLPYARNKHIPKALKYTTEKYTCEARMFHMWVLWGFLASPSSLDTIYPIAELSFEVAQNVCPSNQEFLNMGFPLWQQTKNCGGSTDTFYTVAAYANIMFL